MKSFEASLFYSRKEARVRTGGSADGAKSRNPREITHGGDQRDDHPRGDGARSSSYTRRLKRGLSYGGFPKAAVEQGRDWSSTWKRNLSS